MTQISWNFCFGIVDYQLRVEEIKYHSNILHFVMSYSFIMVCPNACYNQLGIPSRHDTARHRAWSQQTSIINISCYTELEAYIFPQIYNTNIAFLIYVIIIKRLL